MRLGDTALSKKIAGKVFSAAHLPHDWRLLLGTWRRNRAEGNILKERLSPYRDGRWRYVGKTSGFDEETMKQLLQEMGRLKTDRPPVKDAEKVGNVKAWVKPKTVVEVKYYEKEQA